MDNIVLNYEKKFEYHSEEEYLLNKYIEQVEFANFKVSRQLESAIERIKDQKFEVKLFIGILIIIIIAYNFSYAMITASGIFVAIGMILNYFCSLVYIIGLPICLYKILKGIIILSIGKQNFIGEWTVKKFSLPAFSSEIQICQIYMQKYKIILEDFEIWKENLLNGIPVDKNVIENRMKDVNLNPQISVTFHNYGKMKRFSSIVAIVISIIIYISLILK